MSRNSTGMGKVFADVMGLWKKSMRILWPGQRISLLFVVINNGLFFVTLSRVTRYKKIGFPKNGQKRPKNLCYGIVMPLLSGEKNMRGSVGFFLKKRAGKFSFSCYSLLLTGACFSQQQGVQHDTKNTVSQKSAKKPLLSACYAPVIWQISARIFSHIFQVVRLGFRPVFLMMQNITFGGNRKITGIEQEITGIVAMEAQYFSLNNSSFF